ncbi:hypothetical protein [Natrialba taiwanensis]|uniref:hypothetical protein n=1 Tax=Natrialba taiwanensis TaxID=160846 RepID=UPI0012690480|nr:hypothetical protein [Natrialba taiwanensis]
MSRLVTSYEFSEARASSPERRVCGPSCAVVSVAVAVVPMVVVVTVMAMVVSNTPANSADRRDPSSPPRLRRG